MKLVASSQRGFSLIELMIAMLLGLILLGAVVTLFSQTRSSFNQNEQMARLQEDGRFALETISRDLSMAGFLADLLAPSAIELEASAGLSTDCGPVSSVNWLLSQRDTATGNHTGLVHTDNASGSSAAAAHACIAASEVRAGSDVVSIKRLRGGPTAAGSLTAGLHYLRTNGTVGLIFRAPMPASPSVLVPAPFEDWQYTPAIYFVRNYSLAAGDGIPTLCRKIIDPSTGNLDSDCLAEGVEDLQIQYGLDLNGNGSVDRYSNSPAANQFASIISVRVSLLMRSLNQVPGYSNDKTYQLANGATYTPSDNYYRRAFTTTVAVRNLRNLRRMGM